MTDDHELIDRAVRAIRMAQALVNGLARRAQENMAASHLCEMADQLDDIVTVDAVKAGVDIWRCDITHNPVGTDTRLIGVECQCQSCRAAAHITALTDRVEKAESQAKTLDFIVTERANEAEAERWRASRASERAEVAEARAAGMRDLLRPARRGEVMSKWRDNELDVDDRGQSAVEAPSLTMPETPPDDVIEAMIAAACANDPMFHALFHPPERAEILRAAYAAARVQLLRRDGC